MDMLNQIIVDSNRVIPVQEAGAEGVTLLGSTSYANRTSSPGQSDIYKLFDLPEVLNFTIKADLNETNPSIVNSIKAYKGQRVVLHRWEEKLHPHSGNHFIVDSLAGASVDRDGSLWVQDSSHVRDAQKGIKFTAGDHMRLKLITPNIGLTDDPKTLRFEVSDPIDVMMDKLKERGFLGKDVMLTVEGGIYAGKAIFDLLNGKWKDGQGVENTPVLINKFPGVTRSLHHLNFNPSELGSTDDYLVHLDTDIPGRHFSLSLCA